MKLKYYLRGLGIGIVVTALLMGYSNKNQAAEPTVQEQTQENTKDVLADRTGEEITTQAQEVSTQETDTAESTQEEQTSIEAQSDEAAQTQEPETTTEDVSETTEQTLTTQEQTEEVTKAATEEASKETIKESTKEEEKQTEQSSTAQSTVQQPVTQHSTVDITIARGDDSGTVARKLQNAGLVENASEYDAYLMQHGYDKKIRVGTVTIPSDATWQEIAEYISGKR